MRILAQLQTKFLTLAFAKSNWEPIDITAYQEPGRTVKIETTGDLGLVTLYPTDDPWVFSTAGGAEPTTIDFDRRVYSCPDGVSTFKIED
jgi:hypothetical protein